MFITSHLTTSKAVGLDNAILKFSLKAVNFTFLSIYFKNTRVSSFGKF